MNEDCLKLTSYFGERDRCGDAFLADVLLDIYARHGVATSLLVRGVEGFGARQHVHTDRLLTLSEDLPVVAVAVDGRERIEAALEEVSALGFPGLVTLERARLLTGALEGPVTLPWAREADTKLTFYVGRQERTGGRPAFEAVVSLLHDRGVAGASVLLGVDGTVHGVRERARFFARNAAVPVMIISVGETARMAGMVPELAAMLERPLLTLERIRVCKRDGVRLAEPSELRRTDPSGLGLWQKLMVYSGEQARIEGVPVHRRLVRELRQAGAAGATTLRGIWGYHGAHAPHGDSFWQLRRRVPLITVVVDTPERIRRWFEIVDALTAQSGLVTSEIVPAFRTAAAGRTRGGVRLAHP